MNEAVSDSVKVGISDEVRESLVEFESEREPLDREFETVTEAVSVEMNETVAVFGAVSIRFVLEDVMLEDGERLTDGVGPERL